jgi:hypothetical protein
VTNYWESLLFGGALGFLVFELTHVFIHAAERDKKSLPWMRPLIDFHLTHHLDSRSTFGFTSPFWDWLFGNLPNRERYRWVIVPLPIPVVPFLISKMLDERVYDGKVCRSYSC